MPLILLLVAALLGPPPDPVLAEADALEARARARAARPGAAVDLVRIEELAQWLPKGDAERRLRGFATDPKAGPLVRAVGWWLLRGLALDRLDAAAAEEARAALGLLTGFVVRPGKAPPPVAELSPGGWRTMPATEAGELVLDAWLRPAREVSATLVTRLVSPGGGHAVLRLGYDDQVKVWLNGDEVYESPAAHRRWLDQAAVPVVLRAGDNRLVVEVAQRGGAWRLLARVTDAEGRPLPVEDHPDPWGPTPEARAELPEADVAHLWRELRAAAEREPADPQDVIDFVDYARVTGLPDADQAVPRVSAEAAWDLAPGAVALRAWVRLVDAGERAALTAKHALPVEEGGEAAFSRAHLRLLEGWQHYYARRHAEVRAATAELADHPPAARLHAVLLEDIGLGNMAVAHLRRARARWPGREALRRSSLGALRTAGRTVELLAELTAMRDEGVAGPDDLYQLANVLALRGETDAALESLARVTRARPALWTYALEAADVLASAGREGEATAALERLWADRRGDVAVAERLARRYGEAGRVEDAERVLAEALRADPGAAHLEDLRRSLVREAPAPRLGPTVEALAELPAAEGAVAQVLYHHARTDVDRDGLGDRRLRRVVRLLSEEGARQYGTVELVYVPGAQQLEVEVARLLRPGAPAASPTVTDRDLSEPEYRLYYDLRAEVLTFPGARPGDLVEVAWRVRDTDPDPAFPGYYGELAWLQESIPRAWTVVEASAEGALQQVVVDRGIEIEATPGRVVARDVPGIRWEPSMPGASSLRAHLHLSTAANWGEVNERYRQLLDGRDAPTEPIAALARSWVGDAETPEEKLRRLYVEVAHRTRYVGLEFGVHSFKPELPAVTLSRGYGDCKDKATLLIALARALGVEAHLTLVRTRPSGRIEPEPASLAVFDHAIVYAPGLDRFLDPTVDRNDPWVLPASDQEAFAFVVGRDDAPRIIPAQPTEANLDVWTLELEFDRSGVGRGEARWETRGLPGTRGRRALEAEGTRSEVAQQALAAHFPGVGLETSGFSGLSPALDPVVATGTATLPRRPARDGGFDLLPGSFAAVRAHAQAAERTTPLEIEHRGVERVSVRGTLPEGWRAAGHSAESATPFGRWRVVTAGRGRHVELDAELRIEVVEVSAADYPAFRAWLAAFDQAVARPMEARPGVADEG